MMRHSAKRLLDTVALPECEIILERNIHVIGHIVYFWSVFNEHANITKSKILLVLRSSDHTAGRIQILLRNVMTPPKEMIWKRTRTLLNHSLYVKITGARGSQVASGKERQAGFLLRELPPFPLHDSDVVKDRSTKEERTKEKNIAKRKQETGPSGEQFLARIRSASS